MWNTAFAKIIVLFAFAALGETSDITRLAINGIPATRLPKLLQMVPLVQISR